MDFSEKTAYVTGGASGIGKAVVEYLVSTGCKVFIADRDLKGASNVAESINAETPGAVSSAEVDVRSWDSQLEAFQTAVKKLGRIDIVCPNAGVTERKWLPPNPENNAGFVKPDLTTADINLTGVLYTISLAIQQYRLQEPGSDGIRGRTSMCGFYAVPTLPIYTMGKHGLVGLTRSYGAYLPREGILLNAVCPDIVETNISSDGFYATLKPLGLLTPMSTILKGFERALGSDSGLILECGPAGVVPRAAPEHLNEGVKRGCELLEERARRHVEP